MTFGSSTLRSAAGSTYTRPPAELSGNKLQEAIELEWQLHGHADLVAAIRARPDILYDRSLLLNLAVSEFHTRQRHCEIEDLRQYCHRFSEFGVDSLVYRQLDVQRYIDDALESSPNEPEIQWPRIGERFDDFHIMEELGAGSIARVYLGLQCSVGNRRVVIKVSSRASLEASILGRLDHPNITPVYFTGYVEDAGLHFICMPFCGRSTLADLIDVAFAENATCGDNFDIAANRWDGSSSISQHGLSGRWRRIFSPNYYNRVLRLAGEIADALGQAHQNRILHGDLKPSNVLLNPEGKPLLLDFNLSQDFSNAIQSFGGTLPYMPPEYLALVVDSESSADSNNFTPAPDVFSFGVLLYELLHGTTPLRTAHKSGDARKVAAELIASYRSGLRLDFPNYASADIQALIHKCLSYDPRQRPQSMAQLAAAIRKERQKKSTFIRYHRAHPLQSVAAVMVLLIVASGLTFYFAARPTYDRRAYQAGTAYAAEGKLPEAIASFDKALSSNPGFVDARFARGQAHLHRGEVDFAMRDFGDLAKKGDVRSMAMLAYCFGRNSMRGASVPWYERAIERGVDEVAVYNNLGATYVSVQTYLSQEDRLKRAEHYLELAQQKAPSSVVVRLNAVRLATTRSFIDPAYDPSEEWQAAYHCISSRSQNSTLQRYIVMWYQATQRYAERNHTSADAYTKIYPSSKKAWQAFAKLAADISPESDGLENAVKIPRQSPSEGHFSLFLEPFTGESPR